MASTKTRRSRKSLEATAYHEAGHAVIALSERMRVKSATIVPGEDYWGAVARQNMTRVQMGFDEPAKMHRYLTREIRVILAGLAAEWRFTGRNNFRGASSDYKEAINLSLHVYGSDTIVPYLRFMSALMKEEVSKPARWAQIKAIAEALMERGTIRNREIREICDQAVNDAMEMKRIEREMRPLNKRT